MDTCEIHLNRRSINKIELPEPVEVSPGSDLLLRIINHGASIHLTLSSSNSRQYSPFFHENLYISDVTEYKIPIRETAATGSFDIEVITGYGGERSVLKVNVVPPSPEENICDEDILLDEVSQQVESRHKSRILTPLLVIVLIGAFLAYGGWLYYDRPALNYTAFALLIVGVIMAWFCRR